MLFSQPLGHAWSQGAAMHSECNDCPVACNWPYLGNNRVTCYHVLVHVVDKTPCVDSETPGQLLVTQSLLQSLVATANDHCLRTRPRKDINALTPATYTAQSQRTSSDTAAHTDTHRHTHAYIQTNACLSSSPVPCRPAVCPTDRLSPLTSPYLPHRPPAAQ